MSAFHPTRRDIYLVVLLTILFGLFLQFDLSLRFTDSQGAKSLLGFKVGFGGHGSEDDWEDERSKGGAWIEDASTGSKNGNKQNGMAEAKIRWGEEGAVRTEVLAHAPGEFVTSCIPVD
jgi:hypothetical protein